MKLQFGLQYLWRIKISKIYKIKIYIPHFLNNYCTWFFPPIYYTQPFADNLCSNVTAQGCSYFIGLLPLIKEERLCIECRIWASNFVSNFTQCVNDIIWSTLCAYDGWMDGCIDMMDGWMCGYDGWMDVWIWWMDGCVDMMDGCMDVWMYGWMYGWMGHVLLKFHSSHERRSKF